MIDFPSSPAGGAVYSSGGKSWQFDGTVWLPVQGVMPVRAGRNWFDNGDLQVWQRGLGPFTTGYCADRYSCGAGTGAVISVSMLALAPGSSPAGSTNSLLFQTTTAGSTASYLTLPNIASVQYSHLRTCTLAFWAYTAAAKTIQVIARQQFGTGGSPSALADTVVGNLVLPIGISYQTITFTYPSIIGKTLGSNGDNSWGVYFYFPVSTLGVQFWDFQLEDGTVASPFEARFYNDQLARCQRFYVGNFCVAERAWSAGVSTIFSHDVQWPVPMAKTPTVTLAANISGPANCTAPLSALNTLMGIYAIVTAAAGDAYATQIYTLNAEIF